MLALDKGKYSGKVIDISHADGLIADVTTYFEGDDTGFEHYHENSHISFILQGGNLEKRQTGEFERFAGQIMFFHSGEAHQSITKIFPAKNINLELDADFLKNNSIAESDINAAIFNNPNAKFTMLKVFKELMAEDEFSESSIVMLLLNLIHSKIKDASKQPVWMKMVSDLLHDRWNETLTLKDLAAAANIHPVTISRYFPKYFGCTLGEYVRKIRIEKSISLIKNSNSTLTEIGFECGFFDQSHFTRNFKTHTGLLPKEFQQM